MDIKIEQEKEFTIITAIDQSGKKWYIASISRFGIRRYRNIDTDALDLYTDTEGRIALID